MQKLLRRLASLLRPTALRMSNHHRPRQHRHHLCFQHLHCCHRRAHRATQAQAHLLSRDASAFARRCSVWFEIYIKMQFDCNTAQFYNGAVRGCPCVSLRAQKPQTSTPLVKNTKNNFPNLVEAAPVEPWRGGPFFSKCPVLQKAPPL